MAAASDAAEFPQSAPLVPGLSATPLPAPTWFGSDGPRSGTMVRDASFPDDVSPQVHLDDRVCLAAMARVLRQMNLLAGGE